MKQEPEPAALGRPTPGSIRSSAGPSGSSPAARALGAACLAAAGLALFAARRRAAGPGLPRRAPSPLVEMSLAASQGQKRGRASPGIASPSSRRRPGPILSVAARGSGENPLRDMGQTGSALRGRNVQPALENAAQRSADYGLATRQLHRAAALLALSVLLDSAIEHYRGQFENPGMFAPLLTSLATTAAALRGNAARPAHRAIYATAVAVGAAGSAFHVYNVARRPGGFCWQNLFYAAPLGAPAALALAGAFGLAAGRVGPGSRRPSSVFGQPAARAISALAGIGMAGSAAEAGLLHFRGAFHRPAMWLPVTFPPVAAAFLLRAAAGTRDRLARAWLGMTALLGVAGVAFHASGVARQMGGWGNWRQNVLSGPPLPAPPSFLALALAGRAALSLARDDGGRH
jgi:hypothetical protein